MKFDSIKKAGIIVEKFIKENAPTIMMACGIASFTGAVVVAVPATAKAVRDIDSCEEELTKKEIVKREYVHYIPSMALAAAGTGLIVYANHMNLKKIEVLAAAYALNKDKFEEYQDKVKEVFGEKKEMSIRDKIAQDHIDNDNPPWAPRPTLMENDREDWVEVRDTYTGVRFKATTEEIDRAVNEFNKYLMLDERMDLNGFYDILGLENTGSGENLVWKYSQLNGGCLMSIDPHYGRNAAGKPVLVLEYKGFVKNPFRDDD